MQTFLSICKLRLLDIFVITKSIYFRYAQTRYDINLVAVRQHIEPSGISSALAHIENLARDLYRCVAMQRNCEAYGLDASTQSHSCIKNSFPSCHSHSKPIKNYLLTVISTDLHRGFNVSFRQRITLTVCTSLQFSKDTEKDD